MDHNERLVQDQPALRIRFSMQQTATSLDKAMQEVEDSLADDFLELKAREGVTGSSDLGGQRASRGWDPPVGYRQCTGVSQAGLPAPGLIRRASDSKVPSLRGFL